MDTAIRENELYVFTHPGPSWRAELEERFGAIGGDGKGGGIGFPMANLLWSPQLNQITPASGNPKMSRRQGDLV
jgi:hypothetical protein